MVSPTRTTRALSLVTWPLVGSGSPSTKVPLRLPRSRTVQRVPSSAISACVRDMCGSSISMPPSTAPRPSTSGSARMRIGLSTGLALNTISRPGTGVSARPDLDRRGQVCSMVSLGCLTIPARY